MTLRLGFTSYLTALYIGVESVYYPKENDEVNPL
jgi:hypothetical protein